MPEMSQNRVSSLQSFSVVLSCTLLFMIFKTVIFSDDLFSKLSFFVAGDLLLYITSFFPGLSIIELSSLAIIFIAGPVYAYILWKITGIISPSSKNRILYILLCLSMFQFTILYCGYVELYPVAWLFCLGSVYAVISKGSFWKKNLLSLVLLLFGLYIHPACAVIVPGLLYSLFQAPLPPVMKKGWFRYFLALSVLAILAVIFYKTYGYFWYFDGGGYLRSKILPSIVIPAFGFFLPFFSEYHLKLAVNDMLPAFHILLLILPTLLIIVPKPLTFREKYMLTLSITSVLFRSFFMVISQQWDIFGLSLIFTAILSCLLLERISSKIFNIARIAIIIAFIMSLLHLSYFSAKLPFTINPESCWGFFDYSDSTITIHVNDIFHTGTSRTNTVPFDLDEYRRLENKFSLMDNPARVKYKYNLATEPDFKFINQLAINGLYKSVHLLNLQKATRKMIALRMDYFNQYLPLLNMMIINEGNNRQVLLLNFLTENSNINDTSTLNGKLMPEIDESVFAEYKRLWRSSPLMRMTLLSMTAFSKDSNIYNAYTNHFDFCMQELALLEYSVKKILQLNLHYSTTSLFLKHFEKTFNSIFREVNFISQRFPDKPFIINRENHRNMIYKLAAEELTNEKRCAAHFLMQNYSRPVKILMSEYFQNNSDRASWLFNSEFKDYFNMYYLILSSMKIDTLLDMLFNTKVKPLSILIDAVLIEISVDNSDNFDIISHGLIARLNDLENKDKKAYHKMKIQLKHLVNNFPDLTSVYSVEEILHFIQK